jgi:hypothetical protein
MLGRRARLRRVACELTVETWGAPIWVRIVVMGFNKESKPEWWQMPVACGAEAYERDLDLGRQT